jgi:hypothetical protein
MKTIEINLYSFNELSDKAKENAMNNHLNSFEYHFASEAMETIKRGLDHFNFELSNYSLDWQNANNSYFRLKNNNTYSEYSELSGPRLFKLINNQFEQTYYKYSKKYVSIFNGNCPFTGVCFDESFIDPIRKFMQRPDNTTFAELMEDCVYSVLRDTEKDIEYHLSEEAYEEECEANEYTFTEDGELYF